MQKIVVFLLLFPYFVFSQKTTVTGVVIDKTTKETLPSANVRFQNSKIGDITNIDGHFILDSYYGTDSVEVTFVGYKKKTIHVNVGQKQDVLIELESSTDVLNDVEVKAPDEFPSTILFRKVVKNKPINNRERLDAYQYETYNKLQLDLNNLGDGFEDQKLVKKLDVLIDYIDSNKTGRYLPLLLSESISDYYYKRTPEKKKEVMTATKLTGIDNLQLSQFMGDMYQDINIYNNYVVLFNKSFISPIANFGMAFYRYYLEDSTFIGNQWCYKLRFVPKRVGDLTFEGEMWIHDTTYAVKEISGNLSKSADLNYVEGMYFEQTYNQVEPEVWMLTREHTIINFKLTQKTKILGFYGRKTTIRKGFVINQPYKDDFYESNYRVEVEQGAKEKDSTYWKENRFEPLSEQEKGIDIMVDSLNKTPLFKGMKNLVFLATTGFYPAGKLEIGNVFNLISFNKVEGIRNELSVRTSNNFSKRLELAAKMAYGWRDQRVKYGLSVRYNITPKKRGMLSAYYRSDIEQLGQSPNAKEVGATFGSLLRNGPLNKLTFVRKTGFNLEKDIGKDLIIYGGFEWKEYTPLGIANYRRYNSEGQIENISKLNASEVTLKLRWGYHEEFISGVFDRISIGSRFPIISFQTIFGIKGFLGSEYKYQKIELDITHKAHLGILGYLKYEVFGGYIFGKAAYPFLEVHPGNQSYWLQISAFNNMRYFEFVSDRYVGFFAEHHWNGLLLGHIPGVRKLQWRIVTTAKAVVGTLGSHHLSQMILPPETHSLNWKPYVEVGVGIENIFKLLRIECTWRLTQKFEGISNFGIRARINFDF